MANIYKERLREICAVHTNKNAILVVSNAHKSQDVKLHFLYLCKLSVNQRFLCSSLTILFQLTHSFGSSVIMV